MPESPRADAQVVTDIVTFLFTDIEGSTALWEHDSVRMSEALAAHDALARSAVEGHQGTVVKMIGDGMHAVFDDALDALAATVDLQQALADPAATNGVALRVRCGLHAGVVERRDNDYFGSPVNRAARIMSAAHGGQVLLSQAVVDRIRETLPAALALRDLGKVRLKDLSIPERVYQVVHPQLRQEFPALRSLEATPNNLPQQVTRFIGREQALAELQRLLARTPLLTLSGSGGCGKTRLSLHVAADSLEQFPDGAWLVELAPLADPGLVPQTVATVLRLKEEPGKSITQKLTEHLKDKRLLLLLDNCEHLLDACARLADTLVRQCPGVKILASSREALGIVGEQTYRVPSLSLPDRNEVPEPENLSQYESVQLFIDRTLLVRPDFQLTARNAPVVASLCRHLDGIPLAIELAAARVGSLAVEEINSKLDQRFRLLTGGDRTAQPRQQTLRACIDWSYDLLHEPERRLLQRLSVFAGGWTYEEAEQVCAGEGIAGDEVLDLLLSLSDKSLVVVEQNDEHSRYRLLETVRQYARTKLVESGVGEAVRERHRDCFLALAEEAELELKSAEQAAWLQRLEEEHENLRAALNWSLAAGGSEGGLRLCGALQRFWSMRGHLSEGRAWYVRTLAKAGGEQHTQERAKALSGAGVLARHQSDYPAARALHEESLAIRRQVGDRRGIANSLNNLGNVAFYQGDFVAARELHDESLVIRRELGDRGGIADSLNNLGIAALEQGEFALAWALHHESLVMRRELGDRAGIADSLNNLGIAALEQGEFASAWALDEESLAISRELGNRWGVANSLEGLAAVVAARARPLCAAQIWGAAARLREEIGSPLPPNEWPRYDRRVAGARAALADDAAFDHAWRDGHALTPDKAIEFALAATVVQP